MRIIGLIFFLLMLELVVFSLVVGEFGLWPVVGWSLFASGLGVFLIVSQLTLAAWVPKNRLDGPEFIFRRLLRAVAGLLLFFPGLISDFIGVSLLFPLVAQFLWRRFPQESGRVLRTNGIFVYEAGSSPPRDVRPLE